MKKLIFFFFLVVASSHFAFGQGVPGKYMIQYHAIIKNPFDADHANKQCTNSVTLKIVFNNTTKTIIDENMNTHLPGAYDSGIKYDSVNAPTTPIKIWSLSNRHWRSGGSCSDDYTNSIMDSLPIGYCQNTFSDATDPKAVFNDWTSIDTIIIYPKLVIQPSVNNYLPNDDTITIYSNTGFRSQEYNWEYSLEGLTWRSLPQYNGQSSINISARDILGSNVNNYLGTGIYFRQQDIACNSKAVSNIVFYTVMQSAPHISGNSVQPVSCYDATDGSVTLHFDRTLLTGETLNGSIVNTTTGAAVANPNLTDSLQTDTTYTITGLAPGNYTLSLIGAYNDNATYTDGARDSLSFTIDRPDPVDFSQTSTTNVYCYGGSDGVIRLTATGGQNQYQYQATGNNGTNISWTNFTGGANTTLSNLSAGTYQIQVRDSHQCLAKNSDGSVKSLSIQITQPAAPIALSDTEVVTPTGYGLSNGYISVRVTGGTPNTDGTYNYEWHKDTPTGTLITTGITTDAVNSPFTIKLGNIPAGKYYLTVKDKNYAAAGSALDSCGIIAKEYDVTQPMPLITTISVQTPIACNINNNYPYKLDINHDGIADEAQSGVLTAAVTGGVGSYRYQWQTLVNGSFQNIAGATTATLSQLQEGTYKILVTDANDNKADTQIVFQYPAVLQISLSATAIACNNQNSGTMRVTATGGVPPYTYLWNTSDTTATVTELPAGNYFVIVKDSNGCQVNGAVNISQPQGLDITDISVQNPVCYGAANGAIQLQVSGGATPYNIVWSNGKTGASIAGLKAGSYTATVTDANGCSEAKEYTLTNPDSITVSLGKDITLCEGDSVTYDVTIADPNAVYRWTDGNGKVIGNNPTITLFNAGTYTATVSDSKGCMGSGSVTIKNSSAVLDPQFMLATYAYVDYNVELVNTSPTAPQQVQWILPDDTTNVHVVDKTNDYLELRFDKTGSYRFGLKGIQGECEKIFYKDIVVEEDSSGIAEPPTAISNIQSFTIAPNPNTGSYTVMVQLYNADAIRLRIISMVGTVPYPMVTRPQATNFNIPFQYKLTPGMYLIILETGTEAQVKKMIVR